MKTDILLLDQITKFQIRGSNIAAFVIHVFKWSIGKALSVFILHFNDTKYTKLLHLSFLQRFLDQSCYKCPYWRYSRGTVMSKSSIKPFRWSSGLKKKASCRRILLLNNITSYIYIYICNCKNDNFRNCWVQWIRYSYDANI